MRLILLLVIGAFVGFYLLVVRRRALPSGQATPDRAVPDRGAPGGAGEATPMPAAPAPTRVAEAAPVPAAPAPTRVAAAGAAPRSDGDLLARIQAMEHVPFVSPGRGAVVLSRFGYGLPESESPPALSDVERTLEVVRRTIQHPHEQTSAFDQFGAGRWFYFRRHVTEAGRRWDFEVDVLARNDGTLVVEDARIVRPGEREEDAEADAEAVEDADTDQAPLPGAARAGEVPAGMVACPCCGYATISTRSRYEICGVCFWEDDGQDDADADEARGGPNRVSLREGRRNFAAIGASVAADVPKVRKPTAEEVRLRRFDAEGREVVGVVED